MKALTAGTSAPERAFFSQVGECSQVEYSYIHLHTLAGPGSLRYRDAVKTPRPGIADADRPRGGSFTELVEQILHDSRALDGIAFAYSELGAEGRRGLIRAVIQDLSDPGPALGTMLAVESDPAVAADLAGLLRQHNRTESFATFEKRPDGGEACLIHHRFGFAGELMRITWNHNQIKDIEIEPRIEVKPRTTSTQSSVAFAIEAVAPLLWRHIRAGGALPEGVERFAGFFSST